MATNGIDVSSFQSGVALKSFTGLDFVLAKATEGTNVKDGMYNTWASEAEALGVQFGAYHFFHAENLQAEKEADLFCAVARPRDNLTLWLDYETYGESPEADAQAIELFISTVQLNVGVQQKVGLYVNGTGLARVMPFRAQLKMAALWYADPSHPMTDQAGLIDWDVHQYEIVGGVDRNYSVWSKAKWESYAAW